MANYKIVFTGSVGAGKASAIETVSNVPLVKIDESASDMTTSRTASTTAGVDHGVLNLNETDRVHLYGTTALQGFDFVWKVLSEDGLGLVLLIDNSSDDPFADLDFYLTALGDFNNKPGLVIGVTQIDRKNSPTLREYAEHLRKRRLNCAVFEVDAREQRDVSILIQTLLYGLDPQAHANS